MRATDLAKEAASRPNDDALFREAQRRLKGAKVDFTGSQALARLDAADAADREAFERRRNARKPVDLGEP